MGHVLGILADRWGLPVVETTTAADAHLSYGNGSTAGEGGFHGLRVPMDEQLYVPRTRCAPREIEGRLVWRTDEPGAVDDPFGSIVRLVACLDDAHVDEAARDERGSFLASALGEARGRTMAEPMVEHDAALLWQRLTARFPHLDASTEPRWPHGHRWALALTHDVDAVSTAHPLELMTNLAKGILRLDSTHLAMALSGLVRRPLVDDPLYGFDQWRRWEERLGITSAFYLAVIPPGVPRHLNDCKSRVDGVTFDWAPLRAMVTRGWEVGLHASLRSGEAKGALRLAKLWLEDRLEAPITGVRHHYFSLDWRRPWRTFRRHVTGGFGYDASMAWRGGPGLRAGTALPYHPLDPATGEVLDVVELPTALMDYHVTPRDELVPVGRAVLQGIARVGGVAVLDWHQEVGREAFGHRGLVGALETMVRPLLEGPDPPWVATPAAIVAHWRARSRRLGQGTDEGTT